MVYNGYRRHAERGQRQQGACVTMIKLYDTGIYLVNGTDICVDPAEVQQKAGCPVDAEAAKRCSRSL